MRWLPLHLPVCAYAADPALPDLKGHSIMAVTENADLSLNTSMSKKL
ncbi:MAG TPA: hypothetical protein VIM63_00940 [Rhodoferax sp.]